MWDLRRGKERQRFMGFDAEVTTLAFSLGGKMLVSGLSNSSLLVWEVAGRTPGKTTRLDRVSILLEEMQLNARGCRGHKVFAARERH